MVKPCGLRQYAKLRSSTAQGRDNKQAPPRSDAAVPFPGAQRVEKEATGQGEPQSGSGELIYGVTAACSICSNCGL